MVPPEGPGPEGARVGGGTAERRSPSDSARLPVRGEGSQSGSGSPSLILRLGLRPWAGLGGRCRRVWLCCMLPPFECLDMWVCPGLFVSVPCSCVLCLVLFRCRYVSDFGGSTDCVIIPGRHPGFGSWKVVSGS